MANHGADLPPLPTNFSDVRVDFPPNVLHDMDNTDRETVYRAFRQDKGQRVLAGLLAARPQGHVMIVDDDDFEVGIADRQERADAFGHGESFVVGRRDDFPG